MVFDECPFCHRPFSAERVSREEVDSNTEGLLLEPPRMGIGRGPRSPAPSPVEIFLTYKTTYRCKHCGKEWTRTSEDEKSIPRDKAGPEQASSLDVVREEEEDREDRDAER